MDICGFMKRVEVIHDRNLIISDYAGHIAEITYYYLLDHLVPGPGGVIYGDLIEFEITECI